VQKDTEAEDLIKDLDAMKGLRGKEWSVALAKKLGLTEAEIEEYLAQK